MQSNNHSKKSNFNWYRILVFVFSLAIHPISYEEVKNQHPVHFQQNRTIIYVHDQNSYENEFEFFNFPNQNSILVKNQAQKTSFRSLLNPPNTCGIGSSPDGGGGGGWGNDDGGPFKPVPKVQERRPRLSDQYFTRRRAHSTKDEQNQSSKKNGNFGWEWGGKDKQDLRIIFNDEIIWLTRDKILAKIYHAPEYQIRLPTEVIKQLAKIFDLNDSRLREQEVTKLYVNKILPDSVLTDYMLAVAESIFDTKTV